MAGRKNPIQNSSPAITRLAGQTTTSKFKFTWAGSIGILMLLALAQPAAASQGFSQNADGNQTVFNQTDMKVYNEVGSYNIGENEIHIYNQPSADAVFLQRVTGLDPSSILGKLTANGHVWIINPSGVLIGSDAVINTAGFLAAAATLDQQDFFSGKYGLTQSVGSVVNKGAIIAENGYVVLAGASVSNAGVIAAGQGDIVLGAGSAMTFDFYGDGLINFAVDQQTAEKVIGPAGEIQTEVRNSGSISGARVVMTANAAREVLEAVVNNEGVIEADSASGNGAITLSSNGAVVQSGELTARGKSGSIRIASDDDIRIDGVVVVEDNGSISIVADQDRDASGDLDVGRTSSATLSAGKGNITLAGNDVRLDRATLVTTAGGDVKVKSTGGFSDTARSVYHVTGSVDIDPPDPVDVNSPRGTAGLDFDQTSENNVNINNGADIEGKNITILSDSVNDTTAIYTGLGWYPNYGDIVIGAPDVGNPADPGGNLTDPAVITAVENVVLDANNGNIFCTATGSIVAGGDASLTAQLVGTVPHVENVYHLDSTKPFDTNRSRVEAVTVGAVNVDIDGTLNISAEGMVDGISGVLDGTAGYLDIDPNTPGVIIWNGIYIDHAGPMAVAYSSAIAQLNSYNVNELGGVEDLRKGIEYYGAGVPYEGLVLDNRVRFDVFNGGVFNPYPDLITDLRLMKACDTDK